MPALEYMKVDAPTQFPSMCICGAQNGPLVDTFIDKRGYGGTVEGGRIYLCRLCVTRAGRALGMVKGQEMTRLQNAADELAEAEKQVAERQLRVEQLTTANADREAKITSLQQYIETLQADITHFKAFRDRVAADAKDMVPA